MKIAIMLTLIMVIIAGASACAIDTLSTAPLSQGNLSVPVETLTPIPQAAALFTEAPPDEGASTVVPMPALPTGKPGDVLLPHTGRENVYSVQLDLVPSKLVYLPGEKVQMELILTNASKGKVEPVIVSQLPPVVRMVEAGSITRQAQAVPPGVILPGPESAKSVIVKTFPAGTEEKTLAAGEKATYQLTWNQKDENGNQVSPGWYYYETNYNFRPESAKEDRNAGLRDRAFLIQYPQGALQKIIEVNQSRMIPGLPLTIGDETKPVDVVITLKRVELNEMGATFYTTMSSPDNPVSGYNNPEWMSRIPMGAQYMVDGVVTEARAPVSQFLDSGIEFRWGATPDDPNYLDPVPADAKEITFVIPEIGYDWKGPWEFAIPLESGLPFEAGMNVAEEHFLPGQDILYGISIKNLSSDKLSIDPFPPAMRIKPVDRDEIVYSRESGNRTLDIGTDYPDSWYHTKGVWDQKDNQGVQVVPGWYEMSYEYEIIEQRTGKHYKANPAARFEIVQPDSSMNKNLEANLSVIAEGAAITLERVELNAVKGTVYLFTNPPGYAVLEGQPPQQAESLMRNSRAEYSVDSGILKQPIDLRMQANENGVRLIWDIEPIPVDAKEITFVVRKIGDWIGPWEFKVKLN
jgi:hypothetical protein